MEVLWAVVLLKLRCYCGDRFVLSLLSIVHKTSYLHELKNIICRSLSWCNSNTQMSVMRFARRILHQSYLSKIQQPNHMNNEYYRCYLVF